MTNGPSDQWSLNSLAQAIHRTAAEHGFWDAERNLGEMLMLATSELAEALEEHRAGSPAHYYKYKMSPALSMGTDDRQRLESMTREELQHYGIDKKPEGVAVELVDCIIRCLDTLYDLDVDIDALVFEKMDYNNSRQHKHGKAY